MLYRPRTPSSSPRFPSRNLPRPRGLRVAESLLFSLLAVSPAVADMVPDPPAECVGKPDGTFCSLGDGTAGQCMTQKEVRRPGRSYRVCKKDEHECDRLAVGAVCHGYLGKPSHCREFENKERGERWRTCQADESPAAEKPTATPPSEPAAAPPSTAPAAPAAPAAPKSRFGCQFAAGAMAAGGELTLVALLGLGLAMGRLRRRQKDCS